MSDHDAALLKAVATLTDEVGEMRHEITDLRRTVAETKEIVEAWGAVKTMGKFLKWLGAVVAAVTAIALGVKLGITHMFGSYMK